MLVYDIHSHMGRTSSGEGTSPARMLEELRTFGITRVGISSLSGIDSRAQNDAVYGATQEHPGTIQGYAFINPKDPNAPAEVDRCLGELGMVGVKFHSWKHGYFPDNALALHGLFEQIQQYGVHVQMHVGTAPFATPYTWLAYAKDFPDINFVFTHTGYYEFGLSTIEAVRQLDNVWVETSGQMNTVVLRTSFKTLGSQRVCFGTDWPYKPINIEISKFEELSLCEADKENVFHRNASYLWGETSA